MRLDDLKNGCAVMYFPCPNNHGFLNWITSGWVPGKSTLWIAAKQGGPGFEVEIKKVRLATLDEIKEAKGY